MNLFRQKNAYFDKECRAMKRDVHKLLRKYTGSYNILKISFSGKILKKNLELIRPDLHLTYLKRYGTITFITT